MFRPILASIVLTALAAPALAEDRPNFVFFLVDDLGWADVGCNGSTFYETPHIDALAESGMRFTQGYAAASICSPTRASILTGRHPVRVNITDWIPGRGPRKGDENRFRAVEDRDNLALDEVTVAEVLKEAGYATFFAGKWHLGHEGHWPGDQGFEVNVGGHHRGSPPGGYYAPWNNPVLEAEEEGEYLTERLTEESIDWMKGRGDDEPFLLYLSYYNVHTPIQPYEKRIEHFEQKAGALPEAPDPERNPERGTVGRPRQDNPELASMIAAVDDSVGAILGHLEDSRLAEDTVVCFFSDNGGLSTLTESRGVGPGCNDPLRAGKGWLYEGGIREATLVRAPGVTEPGSVCDEPVVSMDFFPTILDLAGLPPRPEAHADGRSLLPLLRGGTYDEPRALHWHYPHYHGSGWRPGAAIRRGKWKLVELWEWDEVELYDLEADVSESNDLADEHPEKVEELRADLAAWREKMGATLPEPNPGWNGGE